MTGDNFRFIARGDITEMKLAPSVKGYKQTVAQRLLSIHLLELGVETVEEWPFAEGRRFRFDLYSAEHRCAFECDGQFMGKHGVGYGEGHEKINLAQALGFRVFQFSNRSVLNGEAKKWLKENLFRERP